MRIQIDVQGGGLVDPKNYFFESNAVPKIGETISANHLCRIASELDIDEDEDWVVKEVHWYFGDLGNQMGCDVLIWVTHSELNDAVEKLQISKRVLPKTTHHA